MRERAAPGPDGVVENTYIPPHFGPLEFFRRLRTDQLSILVPEMFKRNITYNRLLFLHSFMVIKPQYIEHVLLTNQKNYGKSYFLRSVLGPLLGEGLLIDRRRHERQAAARRDSHHLPRRPRDHRQCPGLDLVSAGAAP